MRILIALFGLLLTSCSKIPTSLEEVVGWRERFFLDPATSQAAKYLTPVLGVVAVLALAATVTGLNKDQLRGKNLGSRATTGFMLMFTVILLTMFVSITTRIGQAILPPELTLDAVFAAMHWELSPDIEKLVTAGWGVSLTLLLPIIVRTWQGVMLLFATIALLWSTIGRSTKGITFTVAMVLGWATFLVFFTALVQFFGENYPTDWIKHVPGVDIAINAFFTGILIILMAICYVAVPIIATILVPELRDNEDEAKPVSESWSHRVTETFKKVDWQNAAEVAAGVIIGSELADNDDDDEYHISCNECGASNATSRKNCEYCGAGLHEEKAKAAPLLAAIGEHGSDQGSPAAGGDDGEGPPSTPDPNSPPGASPLAISTEEAEDATEAEQFEVQPKGRSRNAMPMVSVAQPEEVEEGAQAEVETGGNESTPQEPSVEDVRPPSRPPRVTHQKSESNPVVELGKVALTATKPEVAAVLIPVAETLSKAVRTRQERQARHAPPPDAEPPPDTETPRTTSNRAPIARKEGS